MSSSAIHDEFSSLFAPEPSSPDVAVTEVESAWKILVVDDEADIHALFRLALMGVVVEERPVQLFYASSDEEARAVLSEHPDMALVLLDVVMETKQAGLVLAHYIRQVLNNRMIQIVLITGQPGYAPQRNVVMDYEINGYRLKSELTADKIFVSVYTAIRTHHVMLKISFQQKLLDDAERRSQDDRMLKTFIVESSEDAIIGKTLDGIVTSWNRAAENIFAYTAEEMVGHSVNAIIPPDRSEENRRVMESIEQGEVISLFETERIKKDGSRIDVFLTISPIRDMKGHTVGISEIARNITERKQAEVKLRLAANVFTHAHEAIMITDLDGTIIDVNDTFSRITGYSHEEVLGKNPRLLGSGYHGKAFFVAMWNELIEKGCWYGELWNRRKNGEVYVEMKTISTVLDAQGKAQHYVAIGTDITLLKEHETQLERLAHYDALTSLPNRVLLADRLHQGMNLARRHNLHLGVVYLDLDDFKTVNDKYGHGAGDQLLMNLASRMKKTLRKGDTLSRLGGDEFVALLPDLISIKDSLPLLNRLLAAAAAPVMFNNFALQVSACLGVTFYPQAQDVDGDQLMRQADQAMYQAKLAGKNRYHVFDTEQDNIIRVYHESLDRIRHALAKHEFILYYQPKVNMRTGDVVGAEALIRWQHPEKGLLLPALFLPVVAEHTLAVEIGEWVIATALRQIDSWHAAGLDIPVSVNIGARQFQQTDFVERLRALLEAHPNVRPGDLELEVLETSALENIAQVSQAIKACQAIGIGFALDDFGTGYSSLNYLKHLSANVLKIDQSFVHDMLVDPDSMAILEGVLSLATAFRCEVIAEGVESVEQGELLLQLGCELAQGYGIGHPMLAHAIPDWLVTWRPAPSWSNLSPVNNKGLPLLYFAVECRAWTIGLENYLKDEPSAPPPINHNEYHFGAWLNVQEQAQYGTQPSIQVIESLHQQLHLLAAELCELHAQGRKDVALARLGELHSLRGTLLEQLHLLVQETKQ